jgi:dihydroxy-acid dehydratase
MFSNKGCAIAHITPEAAEGGLIAVVESGDIIAIDIPNRELNIRFFRSVEPASIKRSK